MNMGRSTYEKPKIEISRIETQDVVRTSVGSDIKTFDGYSSAEWF